MFLSVWIDTNVDKNKAKVHNQERLWKVPACLVTFDEAESCKQSSRKCSYSEEIILIIMSELFSH